MLFSKNAPKFWVFLLIILVLYLSYQLLFGWDEQHDVKGDNSEIEDGKVAFVVIEENNIPSKKSNLEPLLEDLIVWNYNRDLNEVYLKFNALLPRNNSKVMIVYDRGFESFESHADVFSISTFPYKYYFDDKPLISIYDADKDGTVYLEFEGKRVKLSPGSTYRSAGVEKLKFNTIKIHNYGLLDKNNFKSEFPSKDLYNELFIRFGSLSEAETTSLKEFVNEKLKDGKTYSTKERERLIVDSFNEFSSKIKKD